MSVNIIATDYTQMSLPAVVDVKLARIPSGTYDPVTSASGTYFTLPGVYGPGDFVFGVSNITGTANTPLFSTVEFRNGGGIVGTLYSRLGTSINLPGTYLGVPLGTTAWIQVSAKDTNGTFTASDDTRMIVSYVHEA